MLQKNKYLVPPVMFLSVWFCVIFCYQAGLSGLLSAPMRVIFKLYFLIGAGYLLGNIASLLFSRAPCKVVDFRDSKLFWSNASLIFGGLLLLSLLEVFYEGYIPFVSLVMGRSVSHFDFGLPSLHGLIIAGFSAIGTVFFGVYLITRSRKALIISLIPILYSLLFVSRKMMTVCFLQYLIVFLGLRGIGLRHILKIACVVLLFVFLFGFIGDLRGRTSTIEKYGQFVPGFEFAGDAGFKWVYLYITTPINNLVYTTRHYESEGNLFPMRTFGNLVPTAVENFFNGAEERSRFDRVSKERYWLKSPVFNVSTGFNAPYLDGGLLGVFIYSMFLGFTCMLSFRYFSNPVGLAVFAAFMAGALITIFSNSYGNLNFVGQFVFFFFIRYPIVWAAPRDQG